MKRIASFSVDHDRLSEGMYFSRQDGDVITYDIRMKKPNGGDYLPYGAIHTIEHLFATYVRNSGYSGSVIYFGPMGCRTGFYLLLRDNITRKEALELTRDALRFIMDFNGEIPGSKRRECGNYLEHDLAGAKIAAADMYRILTSWNETNMIYEGVNDDE